MASNRLINEGEVRQIETVVSARGLVKRYGSFEAVKGIDFDIAAGECFGLLGPNGAGKSTTIRMICCLTDLTAGNLTVLGQAARPGNRVIKRQLGVVSQDDHLDPSLTVRENAEIHGRFYGLGSRESRARADELLEFMQLEDRENEQVRALSGGMRRRLVIARALMGRPRLLILDEPTTGLDPQARILVWTKIRELRGQGVTVLLTTHYMDEAQRLADHLVVVDHGTVLERGTPHELIRRVVGDDCLEIPDVGDDRIAGIRSILSEFPGWMDYQAGALLIYSDAMDDLVEALHGRGLMPRTYYRRRASLEDVFLKLTGRELRE